MEENKWEILKRKQAENIAKLAEKNPDDWLYSSEMKKPETRELDLHHLMVYAGDVEEI